MTGKELNMNFLFTFSNISFEITGHMQLSFDGETRVGENGQFKCSWSRDQEGHLTFR